MLNKNSINCRILLFLVMIIYPISGFIYYNRAVEISQNIIDERIFISFLMLLMVALSYFWKKIEENLYIITEFLLFFVLLHILFVAYQNFFIESYTFSFLLALLIINFMFIPDKVNKILNIAFIFLVTILLMFSSLNIYNKLLYTLSVILVSFGSIFINKYRFEAILDLKLSQNKYESLFKSMNSGFAYMKVIYNRKNEAIDLKFIEMNQAFQEILGRPADLLINKNISEVFANAVEFDSDWIEKFGEIALTEEEIRFESYSETFERWFQIYAYSPRPEYCAIILNDITERKLREEKMKHYSFHDHLTGLYNRAFLEEELHRLDTERQLPLSVIMGDVNGLKLVNDTFGHNEGDQLLKKVANVIKDSLRDEDIVGRWGGDEFLVILPLTTAVMTEKVMQRIKNNCKNIIEEQIPLSIALGRATLKSSENSIDQVMKLADENMYINKSENSKQFTKKIADVLLNRLEKFSAETREHTENVKEMAIKLGKKIDLDQQELAKLALTATLHDVGIINISGEILNKSGRLSLSEWEQIKSHPEVGYRIVRSMEEFTSIASYILHHHEHWNGQGYPDQLAGEEIPLLSRIIAIADAYDVMLSGRPYQEKLTQAEAKAELKKFAGKQFDPKLVKYFLDILK